MSYTRADFRNCLACVAVCMAALLLAWPFANISFNDDWTWALTVKQLQLKGHLIYNGWSSPSVIAQGYWGLIWVKLFGFSFNVLRISTIPMAAGCVAVTYYLARQCRLAPALCIFMALTLGLCPVFMPLESSFMTDVPGLFFLLFSMFALVRGYEEKSYTWIFTGAILALIGGSSRQVVWIVPLMALPYFAFLRRSDRSFLIAAVGAWLLVFIGAVGMQHWFGKQPFAVPDPPSASYLREALRRPGKQIIGMVWVAFTLTLMILPIAMASLRRLSPPKVFLALVLALLMVGFARHFGRTHDWVARHGQMPWMENIITTTGVLSSNELSGGRPVSLTAPVRWAVSGIVFGAAALLLSSGLFWLSRSMRPLRRITMFFIRPAQNHVAAQTLLLTTIAYLGLELTRVIFEVGFDRHLLALVPFIGIPILLAFQHTGLTRMPICSWIALIVLGLYGLAITQDLNALARARVTAINRLSAAGIDDVQIDAGFEHNYWTQADRVGHINDARLRNPPGIYDNTRGPTPDLKFLYCLERGAAWNTVASSFGTVDYFSLLPPFRRTVFIDKFTDPWWLDETKAATRPVKQLLPKLLIDQYPPSMP